MDGCRSAFGQKCDRTLGWEPGFHSAGESCRGNIVMFKLFNVFASQNCECSDQKDYSNIRLHL